MTATLFAACADPIAAPAKPGVHPLSAMEGPTVADTASATRARLVELASRPNRGAMQALVESPESVGVASTPFVFWMPMPNVWAATSNGRGLGAVSNLYDHSVTFINIATTTTAGAVYTNWFPTGLAFSTDGSRLFVGTQGGTVDVIDPVSLTRIARWTVFGDAFTVAPHPNGSILYSGTNFGYLHRMDASNGAIFQTERKSFWPINGLAVNVAGTRVYATNWADGQFLELDATTLVTLRTWNLGGVTQGIALSPNGNRAIVANEAGYVTDIDLRTGDYVNYQVNGLGFGVVPNLTFGNVGITLAYAGRYQTYGVQTRVLRPAFSLGADIRRGVQDAATRLFMVTDFGLGRVNFFRQ